MLLKSQVNCSPAEWVWLTGGLRERADTNTGVQGCLWHGWIASPRQRFISKDVYGIHISIVAIPPIYKAFTLLFHKPIFLGIETRGTLPQQNSSLSSRGGSLMTLKGWEDGIIVRKTHKPLISCDKTNNFTTELHHKRQMSTEPIPWPEVRNIPKIRPTSCAPLTPWRWWWRPHPGLCLEGLGMLPGRRGGYMMEGLRAWSQRGIDNPRDTTYIPK